MRRTMAIMATTAAAMSAMTPSIAHAQSKYFMREKLVGVPITNSPQTPPQTPETPPTQPYTYSASPGAWSACIDDGAGGLQARTVNCKRSDGANAADTDCPTVTSQQSCTMVNRCNLNSKTGVAQSGTGTQVGSAIYNTTDAKRACTAHMNRNALKNGLCGHIMTASAPSYGNVWYYGSGTTYSITSAAIVYAGTCS